MVWHMKFPLNEIIQRVITLKNSVVTLLRIWLIGYRFCLICNSNLAPNFRSSKAHSLQMKTIRNL